MGIFYTPKHGCLPDPIDARDFKFKDVMRGQPIDWNKPFSVYDDVGLIPEFQDQGSSSSCVSQATGAYTRVWIKKLMGVDIDFSEKFVYSQIALPGGGAYLRDGVKIVATKGCAKESLVPSYKAGQKPPDEQFMLDKTWMTPDVMKQALPFDKFTYRVIEGQTYDINIFAAAIRDFHGCVAGFIGSNSGWVREFITPPGKNESTWGHAVFLGGFGVFNDQKCVFIRNSWGGRYTIKSGIWKGFQAIPESYFEAKGNMGVNGEYVMPAWVLVPDTNVTPDQKIVDFLKKNEGRLVQDSQGSGSFGLVKGGKILVATKARLPELLATYLVNKEGTGVPKDIWDNCPQEKL